MIDRQIDRPTPMPSLKQTFDVSALGPGPVSRTASRTLSPDSTTPVVTCSSRLLSRTSLIA
jgi:hypothetical protein